MDLDPIDSFAGIPVVLLENSIDSIINNDLLLVIKDSSIMPFIWKIQFTFSELKEKISRFSKRSFTI